MRVSFIAPINRICSINDSNCTCASTCGCKSFQSCSTSCCYRIPTGLQDGYSPSPDDGGDWGRKVSVSGGSEDGQCHWGVESVGDGSPGSGCCGLM